MIYSDQHLHTSFSGDSRTPPERQIEKALSLGMEHICITDHYDPDVVSDICFDLDIPAYFAQMNRLKEKYRGRIDISIGVELGLQSHITEKLEDIAKKYPFDYVIGSIHFVDGLDPYYPEYFQTHTSGGYERFFEVTLENVKKNDCYDSLGHLDYIVRYGRKLKLPYSYRQFAEYIDPVLQTLIEKGKALECNTGGLSRGLDEPNPCAAILRRFREMGGELVTLGSDAHSPETLGFAFDKAGEILKSCGFTHYAVYKDRRAEMTAL